LLNTFCKACTKCPGNAVKGDKRKKFDVEKLKENNTVAAYEERIKEELRQEEDSIEKKWNNIKNTINTTVETVLDPAKGKTRLPLFNEECKTTLEVREEARVEYIRKKTKASQEVYRCKRRDANRICRRKKAQK
jgi:hypothetical protein